MSSTTEEKQQEAVENGVPSPQNTEETTSASEKAGFLSRVSKNRGL